MYIRECTPIFIILFLFYGDPKLYDFNFLKKKKLRCKYNLLE